MGHLQLDAVVRRQDATLARINNDFGIPIQLVARPDVSIESEGIAELLEFVSIQQTIDAAPAGNTRKPVFSRLLAELLEQSWLWASVETNARSLRSGAAIFAMLSNPNRFVLDEYYDLLKPIGVEDLKSKFSQILAASTIPSEQH